MKYVLEIEKAFNASQGLKSPIRDSKGLPALQPSTGYQLVLKTGIIFDEMQLTERGWFVDTDAVDVELEAIVSRLSSKKWTELFEFRPTFELVARWIFIQLQPRVAQLDHITLVNQTLGITVRYTKDED